MNNTKFFTFHQNNSGGAFEYDKEKGITHYVIIEASALGEAIDRAEGIGLYFNGIEKGIDCECCGDRWSEPWDEGTEKPEVWGEPASVAGKSTVFDEGEKEIAVHYLDGRIEWF